MNYDYIIAALLVWAATLAVTLAFGLVWNRSRLADRFETRLSFIASIMCSTLLLPVYILAIVLVLEAVLG